MGDLRDYGLGDSTQYVRGVPQIVNTVQQACPHCKCPQVFVVKVTVEHPMLQGERGKGTYMGCAACPWASKMLMVSEREQQ